MKIFVFGNPDMETDSLPLKILPQLEKELPEIDFQIKDPNEEFEIPEEFVILDTVHGIDNVQVFSDLKSFSNHPHVSLHDFDLWSELRYLEKLGKLKKIKIIGIPPNISQKEALLEEAIKTIRRLGLLE